MQKVKRLFGHSTDDPEKDAVLEKEAVQEQRLDALRDSLDSYRREIEYYQIGQQPKQQGARKPR